MRRTEKRDNCPPPGGDESPSTGAGAESTGIACWRGRAAIPTIIMGSKSGARSAFEICKCLCVQSECDLLCE